MHLPMAASLPALFCAKACDAKPATESATDSARRYLHRMGHLLGYKKHAWFGPRPARRYRSDDRYCPSRARTPAIRVSPDKWMRFVLISIWTGMRAVHRPIARGPPGAIKACRNSTPCDLTVEAAPSSGM